MPLAESSFKYESTDVTLRSFSGEDGMYVRIFIEGFAPIAKTPWPSLELNMLGPFQDRSAADQAGQAYACNWISFFGQWRPTDPKPPTAISDLGIQPAA
ncbi:MAG: hypothetical protein WC590_14285 [Burkholderiaceae bacterium]